MNLQSYQRLIIGYHGCDAKVADQAIRTGGFLQPSENEYDWLGSGKVMRVPQQMEQSCRHSKSFQIIQPLAAPGEGFVVFLALRAGFQQALPQGHRVGEGVDGFGLAVGELQRVAEVA